MADQSYIGGDMRRWNLKKLKISLYFLMGL
jgi:hypothetical protein